MRKYQLPPDLFPQPTDRNISSNQLLKLVLVALLCAILAVFLLPNQGNFPFSYSVGSPWNSKTLSAPFDFEVLRPIETVKDELADIEEQHAPYYLLDFEKVRHQKRHFAKLLEERIRISRNDVQYAELVANSGAYLSFGQELLDKMYKIGVNSSEDQLVNEDPGAKIWLANGVNSEKLISIQSVLTPQSAADFLSDSLPFSDLRHPEFILPLLEQSISSNITYNDSLTLASKRRKISQIVSTGITVRKGEKIIKYGEIVSDESFKKLDSLSQHYKQGFDWKERIGFALMFFGLFFSLFIWIYSNNPLIIESKSSVFLILGLLIGSLALLKFGNRVGVGVPFLLPICGISLFVNKIWNARIALSIWLCILLISAFGLDWGVSWLILQLILGFGLFVLIPKAKTDKVKFVSALVVTFITNLFWLAISMSNRVPDGVQANEVPFFILIAALIALFAERMGRFVSNNLTFNND
jgi:cyclic-di-AMP phosphodiesterase PgpH